MNHLLKDTIVQLAKCIADDLPFTADERMAMEHIRVCDDCCRSLIAMAALLRSESDAGMAETACSLHRVSAPVPVQVAFHCTLQKLGENFAVSLQQTLNAMGSWRFMPPLAAAARSSESAGQTARLEDIENEKTFVLIDSEQDRVIVQIDTDRLDRPLLEAHLVTMDGRTIPITFTQHQSILHALISPIPDNEFDLIVSLQE